MKDWYAINAFQRMKNPCKKGKKHDKPEERMQIEFQRQADKAGNKYVVVRSVKEAIDTLKSYLE